MARMYFRTGLTGGGSGDLDGIDGAVLSDRDGCIVIEGGYFYFYMLDADAATTESSPDLIAPNINPGNKRWRLQTITQAQNVDDVPTFQGLTVEKDAKVKQDLEVLQQLIVGGEVSLQAAATIAGLLTVNNDVDVSGNVDASGFTIDGTPVGTSTDTYWNADAEGNISYGSGEILGNPLNLNKSHIESNAIVPEGYNAVSVGPLKIDGNVKIDGVWKIL